MKVQRVVTRSPPHTNMRAHSLSFVFSLNSVQFSPGAETWANESLRAVCVGQCSMLFDTVCLELEMKESNFLLKFDFSFSLYSTDTLGFDRCL